MTLTLINVGAIELRHLLKRCPCLLVLSMRIEIPGRLWQKGYYK